MRVLFKAGSAHRSRPGDIGARISQLASPNYYGGINTYCATDTCDFVAKGEVDVVFERLVRSLYADVQLGPDDKPIVATKSGSKVNLRFMKKWWFWAGVAAVATAITVPLLVDGDDGAQCPGGAVCGNVLVEF